MKINTRELSLIAVFAALSVVCDVVVTPGFSAGVWYGWVFLISPLTGIILGPYHGFLSTLIGVVIGHSLVSRETVYEFVFTLGAPTCSMVSGFVYRGAWKRVFGYYTVLLASYFLTPLSRQLPIWGMWDCYLAYFVLIAMGIILTSRGPQEIKGRLLFALSAFLGLEADVLLRIFILVPCQAYHFFYGLTPETLVALWAVPAPLITPFKVIFSAFLTTLITPRIMRILKEAFTK
jgi:hypothetical protein